MKRQTALWQDPSGRYYYVVYDSDTQYVNYGSGNLELSFSIHPNKALELLASGYGDHLYSREGFGPDKVGSMIKFVKKIKQKNYNRLEVEKPNW